MKLLLSVLLAAPTGASAGERISHIAAETGALPRADFDVAGFGRLPALHNGRIKPLDTIARTSLLILRGKQTTKEGERSVGATEWMLDLMASPEAADAQKVFLVQDPDILGILGEVPGKEKYRSFRELLPRAGEIHAQALKAREADAKTRSRFQNAVVNLDQRLDLYQRLKNSLGVSESADFPAELAAYESALGPGVAAVLAHRGGGGRKADMSALAAISGFFARYRLLSQVAYFKALPPPEGADDDAWDNVGEGLLEALRSGKLPEAARHYAGLLAARRRGAAAAFNRELALCRVEIESREPRAAARARREELFNRLQPFYQGMVLYTISLLLCFLSWLAWPKRLGPAAFWTLVAAFAVHSGGLVARMLLQGRPPVTNLYSSAIFVGWAAVLLGIVLERVHRRGIAQACAAAIGFTTLIIAHHLAAGGDTLEMMQAVLDSNFWLGTHVVAITIGYSSTFLAGILAHVYILRGALSRSLSKETTRALAQMTYGVVCFALLFSFVGTILGGIWADQSWGRFWGWDPKENGALMIVLWNAIILHARWGGFIRQRGLMVMAVFGNVVTALSWFGVNMLGIGLHSYGFMDKAFWWLVAFVASQAAVMAVGLLPAARWRSPAAA
ncbi:MAG TPA: cytochrome c biogenesis protein CcsA [Elusimicrobiota bacterium]|nr:cytochrome c biogenesis protein CcsA [Elusimicrobiota bacterium]